MLDPFLNLFGIRPDHDFNIMRPGQSLFDVTACILRGLQGVFEVERPDVVLGQGDTKTAFVAALASFYMKIKIGHI